MIGLTLTMLVQAASSTPPIPEPDVVVTGRPLKDTADKLAACLARHCPVVEDAKATLDHAENLFVHGSYDDAKQVLAKSIGRNHHAAQDHPVLIAGLYRANARLAAHQGNEDAYRIGLLDTVDKLRAGLAKDDARVLAARIEVADVFAQEARGDAAAAFYHDIAKDADHSAPIVRGYAMLRLANLYQQMAEAMPSPYRTSARRATDALLATTEPELRSFRDAARILVARAAMKAGDAGALDRLLAQLGKTSGDTPLLVFRPPIKALPDTAVNSTFYPDQWIDIGFWVRPNGMVVDVEPLRRSPALREFWLPPIFESIRASRYAPMDRDPHDPGSFRVERYSRVASMLPQSNRSRIQIRGGMPRVEMLDLTATPQVKSVPAS